MAPNFYISNIDQAPMVQIHTFSFQLDISI